MFPLRPVLALLVVAVTMASVASAEPSGQADAVVAKIVAGHANIHTSIYRDSMLTIDVSDVDPISDNAAILHFWARLSAPPPIRPGHIRSTR